MKLFNKNSIKLIGARLVTFMNGSERKQSLAGDENVPVNDDRALIDQFNSTSGYYPEGKTILDVWQERVTEQGEHIAVVCSDRKMTYAELNDRSNKLGRYLKRELGAHNELLVGIIMHRSERLIEVILSLWKMGGVYVPIDPEYPAERMESIVRRGGIGSIITAQDTLSDDLFSRLSSFVRIINIDLEHSKIENEPSDGIPILIKPESLAYVIHTSGSSGIPKGAMTEHGGMLNHIYSKINTLSLTNASVLAQNAPHSFVISIWQMFAALLCGGQTVVYKNETVLNTKDFLRSLEKDGVTVLEVVPSYLGVMLDALENEEVDFSKLAYLVVTGELLLGTLVKRWFKKFPGKQLVNAYGSTEASDDITHHVLKKYSGEDRIPVGRVIQNLKIYIVDEALKLCPVGVKGEICVSGIGVGRGYLNDEVKTREVFIDDPFRSEKGVRMYRTGDVGKYRLDGTIEYYGRKDLQVKIRGHRIELGEVQCQLSLIPGVKESAVEAFEETVGNEINKYLCGYVVMTNGSDVQIKEALSKTLPGYMVPSFIIKMDKLPLTPSGKLNRKALPRPAMNGREKMYVAPESALEKKLAMIWEDVLGIEKVGVLDDFFSIGGDSLKAIRIISKIRKRLNEIVHISALYDFPTIKDLALNIEKYKQVTSTSIDENKLVQLRRIIKPLASFNLSQSKNKPALFVLCSPRSGSTLLRAILGGHSQLFAPPELELLGFNTLRERKAAFSGKFSLYTEGTIRAIMDIKKCDADAAKSLMESFEEKDLTIQEFYGVMQSWVEGKLLIDKSPFYALDLEILKRGEKYFENARYIHLIRNPFAVVNSFVEARIDQLFRYNHNFSVRELAELVWIISHQNIQQFLSDIPPHRKQVIVYEDLVKDPENVVAGICQHLDLTYETKMLRVYDDPGKRMMDGIHPESKTIGDVKILEHTRINSASADHWKKNLNVNSLSEVTKDLAQSLGYPLSDLGVEETMTVKKALPRIFRLPFVKKLAERFFEGSRSPQQPCIVAVQPKGYRTPFFAVPGYLLYYTLSKHMGENQPFYGFEPIDKKEVEKIASVYVRHLKFIQPQGPYYLGGYCANGFIAYEMAQQLLTAGQKVDLLVLFETYTPEGKVPKTSQKYLAEKINYIKASFTTGSYHDKSALISKELEKAFNYIKRKVSQKFLGRGYKIKPYPGKITLCKSSVSMIGAAENPYLGWDKYCPPERLEVITIPGNHESMLKEPHAQILASHLKESIEKTAMVK